LVLILIKIKSNLFKKEKKAFLEEPAMEKLCRQCTENELRWIFHIILGDIERALGVNSHTILEWLRPLADNMWKV
jgi:hypothetical protein